MKKSDRKLFVREHVFLYGVTDRMWIPRPYSARDPLGIQCLCEDIESCIQGGVTMIQLREKNVLHEELIEIGNAVRKVCARYGIPFIVNDDITAALELGADGVHVGQHDTNAEEVRRIIGGKMILGVSAQTADEARTAEKAGADYIGAGAVFSTFTKKDADYVSFSELKNICSAVNIPVTAIGGITAENIHCLAGSGIAGVALVSALFASADKKKAAEKMARLCMPVRGNA